MTATATISQRAQAALKPTDMPPGEQPLSEQFRIISKQYVDADAAAYMLAESKSAVLAEMTLKQIEKGQPVGRSELIAKASPEWRDYLDKMVEARRKANLLRHQLKYIEMKRWEQSDHNATARAEMNLR